MMEVAQQRKRGSVQVSCLCMPCHQLVVQMTVSRVILRIQSWSLLQLLGLEGTELRYDFST